jgi:hypothetical protein
VFGKFGEKPEAAVMRKFAKFAAILEPHLRNPQPARVAIIASQSAQYSPLADAQIEAQRKSARALAYYARLTPYLIYENQIEKLGTPKLAILPSAQSLTERAWRALMKYVEDGGNLLITGPVDRDEHWQRVNRATELIHGAHAVPITYRSASVVPADASPSAALRRLYASPLSFDLQAQSWLESLRFGNPASDTVLQLSESFTELKHGKGRIFWAVEPVELAQGLEASADIYTYVASRVGMEPGFDVLTPLSPGVMVYPMTLEDSVLYIVVSDNAQDAKIDLRDKSTGVRITLSLPAEHASLVLIGKKEKAVIGSYEAAR